MSPRASPDRAAHRARPWRVHELAADFELLDLWEIPIEADPAAGDDFAAFHHMFRAHGARFTDRPVYSLWPSSPSQLAHLVRLVGLSLLVGLRSALGRVFRWDRPERPDPIPGCPETSLRDRLSEEEWTAAAAAAAVTREEPGGAFGFQTVYQLEKEALHEVSNKTIHALLHLSWVESAGRSPSVVLAIYVKSRGWQSRAYLALIKPFRHAVVYPAWIEHLTRTWACVRPGVSPPTSACR
ncbi:MAG: DUF2867 domain-containing protein [Proteobacteria bacterium]|nr:DUF2867 domain-containing protein [Pseudomonadota bacterium]